MEMRRSSEIQRVFSGMWNFCRFRWLQFGLFGAGTFIIIAAPLNNAVAQFPGVGSEAPSGVATTASDELSSDAAYRGASVSDAGYSDMVGNASDDASDVSSQSHYDGGDPSYRSLDQGISTVYLKKKHDRKKLFIKKLQLEFAAIEFVERKTGFPFSRGDVPRYLDELRSDLKMVATGAENGEIIEDALKSIASDAYLIESYLNDHLDQLLEQAGQPVPRKSFFSTTPALPKASRISGAEIDALSLKFELAEYGEKALQAMGQKRY